MNTPALAPRIDAADLKSRIDLRDFVQALGLEGRRSGKAFSAKTPWRDDRRPSLGVYANSFTDFTTGEHGDIYTYVEKAGLASDFPDALKFVARRYGDPGSVGSVPRIVHRPAAQRAEKPDEVWQRSAEQTVRTAAEWLFSDHADGQTALQYLIGRGLTPETIRTAELGYSSPNCGETRAAPGILIPWRDTAGGLFSVRVRRRVGTLAECLGIEPDKNEDGEIASKYTCIFASKPSAGLYDATAAIGATVPTDAPIFWTEGEFDALVAAQALAQSGWRVVTRGSAQASCPDWLAAEFAERTIYLALDSDKPGQQGRDSLIKALQRAGAKLFNVAMPSGCKDITEAVLAGHDLDAIIAGAVLAPILSSEPAPGIVADALHSDTPLSDIARSTLLNIAPLFAVVAELLKEARADKLIEETFRQADLNAASEQLGRGVSSDVIRRGVEWCASNGVFVLMSPRSSLQEERDTESVGDSQRGHYHKNSVGGRPPATYTLASAQDLQAIFKRLAEQVAIVHNFTDAAPMPRADMLASYDPDESDAEAVSDELRSKLKPTIKAQPGYAKARGRAKKKVEFYTNAMARSNGERLPAHWQFHDLRAYRAIVLRRYITAHDGENITRGLLASVIGVSKRRIGDFLELAGVESTPQSDAVSATLDQARQVVKCPAFDPQRKAKPIAVIIGKSARAELPNNNMEAELAQAVRDNANKALAQAELSRVEVKIEYRTADRRDIATADLPPVPRRRRRKDESRPNAVAPITLSAPGVAASTPVHEAELSHFERVVWPNVSRRTFHKYLELATTWCVQGDQLLDSETGEILPNTPRNVIALLLERPAPDTNAAPTDAHSALLAFAERTDARQLEGVAQ